MFNSYYMYQHFTIKNLSFFPQSESRDSEYYRGKNQYMHTHYMMAPCGRKPVSCVCQSRKHQFLHGIPQSLLRPLLQDVNNSGEKKLHIIKQIN